MMCFSGFSLISPQKCQGAMAGQKKSKNVLDTISPMRTRGRKRQVSPWAVRVRAANYRGLLDNAWDRLSPALLEAQTPDDVIDALHAEGTTRESELMPQSKLILEVLNDPMFPKRRHAQINFLADSLAGLGKVSARRSRDICAQERARAKRAHHIIRCEFYVECSCGYKGHSRDHACRKCGASIRHGLGLAQFF